MAWCENNGVDFLFGLAKNSRLVGEIEAELAQAAEQSRPTEKPARRFKDFTWQTRKSWSRERRVVAKAEWTGGEANPRFVVTSLARRSTRPATFTKSSTAPVARWKTESRACPRESGGVPARPVC